MFLMFKHPSDVETFCISPYPVLVCAPHKISPLPLLPCVCRLFHFTFHVTVHHCYISILCQAHAPFFLPLSFSFSLWWHKWHLYSATCCALGCLFTPQCKALAETCNVNGCVAMTTLQGSRARERGKCECWHHRLKVVKIVTLSIAFSKWVRDKWITPNWAFSLIANS